MMKNIFVLLLAFSVSAGLFAQTPDADFEIQENESGSVTITKYVGWDGGSITIPAQINGKPVTRIGSGAFEGSSVTTVVIPDGVAYIGGRAFYGNQLTSITLGKDVTYIGDDAFDGAKLTSVTLAANITAGLSGAFGSTIFYNYLANDRKAGTYTPGMKAEKKTSGDFEYIETRYGLVITRYNQRATTALRIPDQINGAAVKAIYGYDAGYYDGVFEDKGISRLLIPDGITYIGGSAFSANQITSVVIPDSVTYIGVGAFASNRLTSLTIGNGVTFIRDNAFGNNQITSVVIPDGVTYIGAGAFYQNQLTSLTIGNGVTYIGDRAFYQNQLADLTIGNSVTYIGEFAFSENQLTSVAIPDSVTYIGDYAFFLNFQLTSVTMPDGVTLGLGVYAVFGNDFEDFYRDNGKKAGKYTYSSRRWSFAEQ
jgi:hypothetical protein